MIMTTFQWVLLIYILSVIVLAVMVENAKRREDDNLDTSKFKVAAYVFTPLLNTVVIFAVVVLYYRKEFSKRR